MDTVKLFPNSINPEIMERLYESLNNEGKVELNDFLNAQDLEILEQDDSNAKISPIPLRYDLRPEKAQAQVLFMDGHEEWWNVEVEFDDVGRITLFDYENKEKKTLAELRPTEDTLPSQHIVEISLVFTYSINGF